MALIVPIDNTATGMTGPTDPAASKVPCLAGLTSASRPEGHVLSGWDIAPGTSPHGWS